MRHAPNGPTRSEQAIAALEIIKALAEAVRDGGADGARFMTNLATRAGRYLKKQEIEGLPRSSPKQGQGRKLVLDRPAALQGLANRWWGYLPPDDKRGEEAMALAREYIRDLRQGSNYAKLAEEMPALPAAGPAEARAIANRYLEVCELAWNERKELLCERCAPGTGALGMNGKTFYAAPIPGDLAEWGCKGTTILGKSCGRVAENRLDASGWEHATKLVSEAAVILGYPAKKARHLFSFLDKRVKRRR